MRKKVTIIGAQKKNKFHEKNGTNEHQEQIKHTQLSKIVNFTWAPVAQTCNTWETETARITVQDQSRQEI
jgi:hypothetical protein